MAGLFTRRLPRMATRRPDIGLVCKWPLGAKLCRAPIARALLVSIGFLHAGPVAAEIVTEDFEAYPLQSDTVGFIDPEEGETIYRVTTTGNTGPSDPIVAVASEALAASTGIGTDGANKYWTLGSSAGLTSSISGQPGHVMIGDVGLGDAAGIITTGGPLATFFSVPRNLTGGEISARLLVTTATPATKFRFLLFEVANREIWTEEFALTTTFQTFTVPVTAFTIPLHTEEGGAFDFTQVAGVGFEIFTTPGTAPALSFYVDDVRIDAPAGDEITPPPPKAMPWISLLLD